MSENPKSQDQVVSIRGNRKVGFSPAVTAAITATAVGIQAMEEGDGLTIGNALGTTMGAGGAYAVTKATDCSIGGALVVGGLAGRLGVLAGAKIDEYVSPSQTESSPLLVTVDHLLG